MGLSLFIYNALLLQALIVLSPVWAVYLLCSPKARAGFWEKLGFLPTPKKLALRADEQRQRIWFHAVSVGEFNAIRPLIGDLKDTYQIIISTTTRTGQELAQRTFPTLPVIYFPYDLRPSIRSLLHWVRPDLVIVAETELWPNFIECVVRHRKVPIIFINGRLSHRSSGRYHWIRALMRPFLRQVTHWYMQSQGDAERIRALGKLAPERVTVVGNLKFDLSPTVDPEKRAVLQHILNIAEGDTVLTLASTHSGEDALLVEAYLQMKRDFPELKLVLAPRHPERINEIRNILNAQALPYSVRSLLSEEHPNPPSQTIIVLNSIGELLTVYSFSTVAVMGGSFVEKGGQNPLEPLSQRVPVIFGPHMENFAEISRMLLEAEAGYQVQDMDELMQAVTNLLTQPEEYDTTAEKGLQLLENNRGARQFLQAEIYRHLPPD
jgi:3-deoxy-D-manno-octulosonic-acid transferase